MSSKDATLTHICLVRPPRGRSTAIGSRTRGGKLCERKVLTVTEAAELLRADKRVISALCEQGRIQCIDIGRHRGHHVWRIHRDVLERELGGKI